MARSEATMVDHPSDPFQEGFSFPVTVRAVIGEVVVDRNGRGVPPHVAAMTLIAQHDTEGCYEFPMADGRTCVVEVGFVEAGR